MKYFRYGLLIGIVLFLFWLPMQGRAQESAQQLFDKGTTELKDAKYKKALEYYRQIDTSQFESGALYMNMGVAFMNLDSLGLAKYYFLKASTFDATRPEAEEAVAYVNRQFSRQSVRLPKLPWQVAFDWLNKYWGASAVLFGALTLLNLGIIIFILRWFVNVAHRLLKISGLVISAFGLLAIALSFYLSYLDQRYTMAVQINEQTAVYENPKTESAVISQAYEGYDFTVDRRKSKNAQNWVYVRMSNGQYGWVPASDIRIL